MKDVPAGKVLNFPSNMMNLLPGKILEQMSLRIIHILTPTGRS